LEVLVKPRRPAARRPAGTPYPTPGDLTAPARFALYRAPGIQVTTDCFTIAGRSFPVRQLSDLRTARGRHDPLTVRSAVATAVVLAGVGVALGYTGELRRLGAASYLGLGVAALLPVLLALLGSRLRPPDYELWGRYEGQTVLLFSSDHEREFGQVSRALLRAREAARYGGVTEPLASSEPWRPMPR
jgi:hypothetical protein